MFDPELGRNDGGAGSDMQERGKRRKQVAQSVSEKEEQTRAMIERSKHWIEESRKALTKEGDFKASSGASPDKWKKEAIKRWGEKVGLADKDADFSWEKYVLSRIATPPPLSPLELLQEKYASDVWRLLVRTLNRLFKEF